MSRLHTITQKISTERTGLRGALFVHVDIDEKGKFNAVRFSHKWKEDDNTLDKVFTALGDGATNAYADFIGQAERRLKQMEG